MSANLEEQEMELEALESIFMDDLRVVDATGEEGVGVECSGKCFAFELDPKESPDDPEPTEVPVRVLLSVAHDGEYPEVAPPLKLRSIRGTNAADMAALEARLAQEVEDNLAAKEWMVERWSAGGGGGAEEEERDEDGLTAAQRAAKEEAERRRREGTPVTPETFAAWQARFEAERLLQHAKSATAAELGEAGRPKRRTGRQIFEDRRKAGADAAAAGGGDGQGDMDEDDDGEAIDLGALDDLDDEDLAALEDELGDDALGDDD